MRILGHRLDARLVYWALDIFTLFSKAEGFCKPTLEAMSAGLPVLATDVPGTREAVASGETGILFPYGDWDAAVELTSSSDEAKEPERFVPKLCPTPAHSSSFERTPAHDAVGSLSFHRKQLRTLTESG